MPSAQPERLNQSRDSETQVYPCPLVLTPHPFKINLFSFLGYAGEMGI